MWAKDIGFKAELKHMHQLLELVPIFEFFFCLLQKCFLILLPFAILVGLDGKNYKMSNKSQKNALKADTLPTFQTLHRLTCMHQTLLNVNSISTC